MIANLIKAVFAALMSVIMTLSGFLGSLPGKDKNIPEIPEMAPGTITAEDVGESGGEVPVTVDSETPSVNYETAQAVITENFSQTFDSFSRDLPSGYSNAENKIYKAVGYSYESAETIRAKITGVSSTGAVNALEKLAEDGYIQKQTRSGNTTYKRLRENIYVEGAASSDGFTYIIAEGTNIKGLYEGSTYSSSILTKLSSDGTLVKSVELSNSLNEIHYTGIAASADSIVLCGYSAESGSSGSNYAFIEKYDSGLNKVLTKKIYGEGRDYLNCIASTPDGGFVAGGSTDSTTHDFDGIPDYGFACAVLMKFNSSLERVWCRYLGGSGVANTVDLDTDSSGSIFADISSACSDGDFAGFSGKLSSNIDNVIIRYDSNGLMKWKCVLSTNNRDYFDSVAADGNGGCLAGGNFIHNAGGLIVTAGTLKGLGISGGSDAVVVSIGNYGNITGKRLLKGTGNDYLRDIAKVSGGWLITGYTDSEDGEFTYPEGEYNSGDFDAFAEIINTSLAKTGMLTFGGEERDVATAVTASGSSFTVFGDIDSVTGSNVTSGYFAKSYSFVY
ncbi:MAG: hypothetical protein IKI78_01445 [Clostridia bacterium]|nr:hypothetical protein [Clostridia bacterium]